MGRHQRSDVPATPRQRRAAELLGVAIGLGVVATVAGVIALAVDNAPRVQADELPQPPEVDVPVQPVAGPVAGIFTWDGVAPYDDPIDLGKNGEGVGSVSAERPRTTSRVVAAQEAAGGPQVAGPVPVDPPNGPGGSEPVPPKDDPLHDDGEFGDGCEQPGTPERCDPDSDDPLTDDGEFGDGCEQPGTPERCDPVVGLPPVIVEEPAEEETPVDEVEVVEPGTEVAG